MELVPFRAAILILLSVLCHLHSGLLGASQTPQNCPTASKQDTIKGLTDYGKALRECGQVPKAIAVFKAALLRARQAHDRLAEADSLLFVGSAQMLNFEYRAALDSQEQGLELAEKIHDYSLASRATGNIANIYVQLGDFSAAEGEAQHALSFFKKIVNPNETDKTRLAKVLLIHATACFELGKNLQGFKDYDEAIAIAKSINNVRLEASLWNERGVSLMHEGNINHANDALRKAVSLSESIHDVDRLAAEKEHLAELELRRPTPDCGMALRLIDEAFASHSPAFSSNPQYYPIHIRGQILLCSGNKPAALAEFKRAVIAARQWRLGALPGDKTSTQTVASLQQVYADYAQLAAETALQNHDNALAFNALEILAENRAASLREKLQAVYGQSGDIPDEYFVKLSQLQAAQAHVTLGPNTREDQVQLMKIRLDISHLENKIGFQPEKLRLSREKNPDRNSLRNIQNALSKDQVLISITVGKRRSYVWAVTAERVSLSRIAGEGELTSKAELFAASIRSGRDASADADGLTRALFAGLPADVWNRSEWMLVADGALLDGIPFCALTDLASANSPSKNSRKLLIEDRSLRFLPSELLLAERPVSNVSPDLHKGFVGIGDPIYNQADSRLVRTGQPDAKTFSDSVTLARLVGSEKEIRSAAKEIGLSDAVLLTGVKATREDLTAAIARLPRVVHFAVHVVSPPAQPQEAALALSIKNGIPELLTPEVVASLRTPGSLVVLSGCWSGQGKVVDGAGLVGLSRAWLLAGAAAVVVSSWPTPDDSGKFFSSFYGHLDHITSGNIAQRAALALRRTQLDMLRGTGYQASPSFWGAFAVIAKE